jgi:hypothetical protein
MNFGDRFARVLVRRDERDFGARVKEQYPQKLRAAVARPAEDADSQLGVFGSQFSALLSRPGKLIRIISR